MNWTDFLEAKDNHNDSVSSYFDKYEYVLVSFVRHSGCTYCREMLSDLSKFRSEHQGDLPFKLLLVHMSTFSKGDEMLKSNNLGDVSHISDPEAKLYQAFDLKQGTLSQLLGFKSLFRGVFGVAKHGIGFLDGDGTQMPGVFLVNKEGVIKSFVHKSAADRVDYTMFAEI